MDKDIYLIQRIYEDDSLFSVRIIFPSASLGSYCFHSKELHRSRFTLNLAYFKFGHVFNHVDNFDRICVFNAFETSEQRVLKFVIFMKSVEIDMTRYVYR